MAKVVIVGSGERKGSYCPQCRKRVPDANRTERGVNCPRCGFFTWADFAKYKPFIDIPQPEREDLVAVDEMMTKKAEEARLDNEYPRKQELTRRPVKVDDAPSPRKSTRAPARKSTTRKVEDE